MASYNHYSTAHTLKKEIFHEIFPLSLILGPEGAQAPEFDAGAA